jgi:hypothetical protein
VYEGTAHLSTNHLHLGGSEYFPIIGTITSFIGLFAKNPIVLFTRYQTVAPVLNCRQLALFMLFYFAVSTALSLSSNTLSIFREL